MKYWKYFLLNIDESNLYSIFIWDEMFSNQILKHDCNNCTTKNEPNNYKF